MKESICYTIFLMLLVAGCSAQTKTPAQAVKTGAGVLLDRHLDELEGKRVGLVMNPTSRVDGVHMLDTLLALDVNVTALFAAEHGFRGEAGAGEVIENGTDQQTGLPVHSLYGTVKKPTPAMLQNVDIILFDLPDVGARFYTYSSTMGLVLEAAAENDKEVWILDRPNPAGGNYVSGWILRDEYKSFVGKYPMPIAYGLTMGEIANMAVGESWLELENEPDLRIIKAEGWKRGMRWLETGLEWIPPSPNLPSFEHAYVYLGTVIFEGTNISEGRGTEDPFLTIGSPNLVFEHDELTWLEEQFNVQLDTVTFTPQSIPGKSAHPKLEGQKCNGIRISLGGNSDKVKPVEFGLALLEFVRDHTSDFEITDFANKLYGIDLKSIIEENQSIPGWQEEVDKFKKERNPYLLYK